VNDTQLILDEIARKVGGGPTGGDVVGLYRGAGGVAGVKSCWSKLPDGGILGQDGIFGVVFLERSNRAQGDAGDLTFFKHDIRLQLLIALGRSDMAHAIAKLQPFAPLVVNAFDTGGTYLAGTANAGALIRDVIGPREADALYEGRIAIEFVFDVTEEAAVVYA
jgi:hypothetical protein